MSNPNQHLRYERQLRGWSQVHLAKQIGVPDYYISRWERGEVLPSPYYQEKLCGLFGKTAQELGFLPSINEVPLPEAPKSHEQATILSTEGQVGQQSPAPLYADAMIEQEPFPAPVDHASGPFLFSLPSRPISPKENHPSSLHSPSLPITPLPASFAPTSASQKPPIVQRKPQFFLLALAVFMLIGAGVTTAWISFHQGVTTTVVGHAYFLSSGQTNDITNQGTADQVQIDLQPLAEPAAGKSYYAWLLPDEDQSENASYPLGKLTLRHGTGSLYYQDSEYTNMLATTSRLLITEEDAATEPLTPSVDPGTWRYQAMIPQTRPRAAAGETSYSVLDHLRHLLTSDPTLQKHQLAGGLATWLSLNTGKVSEWSSSARGEWQPEGAFDPHLIRQQLTRIIDYLDGTSLAQRDIPPTSTAAILVDTRKGGIGLLQFANQQQPPGYLKHIEFHLHGLISAPGVTSRQREQANHIEIAINTINGRLQQVRQDAKDLLMMPDTTLQRSDGLTILNDLQIMATTAYSGKMDAVTGTFQEGAVQVELEIQNLATLEIVPYKR